MKIRETGRARNRWEESYSRTLERRREGSRKIKFWGQEIVKRVKEGREGAHEKLKTKRYRKKVCVLLNLRYCHSLCSVASNGISFCNTALTSD
jgi:hypothetical protein